MWLYIFRRLLLIVPTILGIVTLTFAVIQFTPGGPVEQLAARISQGLSYQNKQFERTSGYTSDEVSVDDKASSSKIGSGGDSIHGLDPEVIAKIRADFGFDKPVAERYFDMLTDFITFDFGDSYYRDISVLELIKEKLPVSISLGLWLTLLTYLLSIPLGIRKAIRSGSRFDVWSSLLLVIGYAVPSFMLAIFLILFFAGGNPFAIFPLKGLVSNDFDTLSWWQQIIDYFWHLSLPLLAMAVGSFTTLTFLTRNAISDEMRKQYVLVAKLKGMDKLEIMYSHVFRNSMMLVIAGFPSIFIGAFFEGSLLIETIFSLDGLGKLGYESIINRDYPVVFATLFIFSLLGLLFNLLADIIYASLDPRNNFESISDR